MSRRGQAAEKRQRTTGRSPTGEMRPETHSSRVRRPSAPHCGGGGAGEEADNQKVHGQLRLRQSVPGAYDVSAVQRSINGARWQLAGTAGAGDGWASGRSNLKRFLLSRW